jgi:RNase P/RNase MRP subunit p29
MEKFIIGNTDFGIGELELVIDEAKNVLVNLKVRGDKSVFEKISAEENSEWNWTLYPPKFYVNKVPYSKKGDTIEINVTEKELNEYEIALYLIEHNDFSGSICIQGKTVKVNGKVLIGGNEMDLEIEGMIKR